MNKLAFFLLLITLVASSAPIASAQDSQGEKAPAQQQFIKGSGERLPSVGQDPEPAPKGAEKPEAEVQALPKKKRGLSVSGSIEMGVSRGGRRK